MNLDVLNRKVVHNLMIVHAHASGEDERLPALSLSTPSGLAGGGECVCISSKLLFQR